MAASSSSSTPKASGNKKEKTDGDKSKTTKGETVTTTQLILIALAVFGLGAILGYIIFYSIYNHRCSDMMDDAERRFKDTNQELQSKLIEAMQGGGSSNDYRESELLDLRGRLESQTGLMDRHQTLLEKHQVMVDDLATAKATQDKALLENTRLERELQATKKTATQLQKSLDAAQGGNHNLVQKLERATLEIDTMKKQAEIVAGDPNCQAAREAGFTHIQALHKKLGKDR